MARIARPLRDRFEEKIEKSADGCWIWIGTTNGRYGVIGLGSRSAGRAYAHRLAWELAHGRPVPDGLEVCHRCDVPLCVRPGHLFLATHAENVADSLRKRRVAAGERHYAARLTASDVLEIRALVAEGQRRQDVAERFGISCSHVQNLVSGVRWRSTVPLS